MTVPERPIEKTRPEAGYTALHAAGELEERAAKATALLSDCTVCPRDCHIDRLGGEKGYCRTGACLQVSHAGPHFGEERELVGRNGSGTIFISHCNLACVFCQNSEISQGGDGQETDASGFATLMLDLQRQGCHNINIVTPTHVVPQILAALAIAADKGLTIPLVYNSGGYDSVETLRLLEGIIDIYMPDLKYSSDAIARALSGVPDYVEVMKSSVMEMHRQVGDLVTDRGIAVRGMILRHLVLPGDLAGTLEVLRFIAREISPDSYINIMPQYRPMWHAGRIAKSEPMFRDLQRALRRDEYSRAVRYAREVGLHRGFPVR